MATRSVGMEAEGGEPSNRIHKHQRVESSSESGEEEPSIRTPKRQRASPSIRIRKHQTVVSSSEEEEEEEEPSIRIRKHNRIRKNQIFVSSSESEEEEPCIRIRKNRRASPSNRIRKYQMVVSSSESEEEEPSIRIPKRQRASPSNRIRKHQMVVSSSEEEEEEPSIRIRKRNRIRNNQIFVSSSESEEEEPSIRIRKHQRASPSNQILKHQMVASGLESEEEQPSIRIRKHQRAPPNHRIRKHLRVISSSEYEDETSEEDEESDERNAEQGAANGGGSISITLTDPQLLDCFICFQALTIPAYQCENGHVVCSTCCLKVRNKCPTCASPAGYSRCRMIEKVLESVKVSCRNTKYGCQEALSYSMKQKQEHSCPFEPCSCPIADCNFKGSSKQLRRHFSAEHKKSAKQFRYDRLVSVSLGVDKKILILQEETDGSLLVLNNRIETLGNVIT